MQIHYDIIRWIKQIKQDQKRIISAAASGQKAAPRREEPTIMERKPWAGSDRRSLVDQRLNVLLGPSSRKASIVDSRGIMPEKAKILTAQVRRQPDQICRIRRRMEELNFPSADPLYLSTVRAHEAMVDLHQRCLPLGLKAYARIWREEIRKEHRRTV